jgi:hypothetical protein
MSHIDLSCQPLALYLFFAKPEIITDGVAQKGNSTPIQSQIEAGPHKTSYAPEQKSQTKPGVGQRLYTGRKASNECLIEVFH